MPNRIVYEQFRGEGSLTAEKLTWEETAELIPGLMRVTADAYTAELARTLGLVSEDHIRARYDPEDPVARAHFLERTKNLHEVNEARITVVRAAPDSGELRGYMKLSPAPLSTRSEPGRFQDADGGYDYEGYYLHDIIVAPGDPAGTSEGRQEYPGWRRGLGSLLLHAGTLLNECDPDLPLVLDAFTGSSRVNAWYGRLGLEPNPDIATGTMTIGNTTLGCVYYATPDHVAVQGVRARLERRRPDLTRYQLLG